MLYQSLAVKPLGALRVAELAHLADVTPATIRYYSRTGLLSPSREPDNDYRCFSPADLRRVSFIRQAQALGLTIRDIKTILETVDQGASPCHKVKSLVEQRRVQIRKQIATLQVTENRITWALDFWRVMGDEEAAHSEYCPLIERLASFNQDAIQVHGGKQRIPLLQKLPRYAAH